jgi:hypothetical protein
VEQQVAKSRAKRGAPMETRSKSKTRFNDPLWDKEWYLVSITVKYSRFV